MANSTLSTDFDWIRAQGFVGWPLTGDAADSAENELKIGTGKIRTVVDVYNGAAATIRTNAHLSPQGKNVALAKQGQEALDNLSRLRAWAEVHISRQKQLIADRVMKPSEGNNVVRAIRAMEIRSYVRTITDSLDAFIVDAAVRGDVDTVEAMANAPAGMLALTPSSIRTAQQVLADKVDPEGANVIRRLGDAVDAFLKTLQTAIDHVGEDSGVVSPDEVLRKIAETGEVPPHLNVTAARPSRV